MSSLTLPPVPPSLKSIAPYLQRADELYQKEPVVAYWCAYYAAQVGISLKAKDDSSRTLLLELLGLLEKMKKEIGPNDAIDIESASAAYVENFALKVFGVADDEDRRGDSTRFTRSTAKKFLAAANFLEALKTFPKTELTIPTEDKIRYAKWKAADIAKAFREGRKPTPGAAGENDVGPSSSPPRLLPPAIQRPSPPPALDQLPTPQPFTPSRNFLGINHDIIDPASPGNWSTAATPGAGTVQGTPTDEDPARPGWPPESPTPAPRRKPRSGSQGSVNSNDSQQSFGSGGRKASLSPRKVPFHFSADATPLDSLPSAPDLDIFPPHGVPSLPNNHAPPQSSLFYSALPPPPIAPAPFLPQQIELTPSVVAKAQKHCRFAISSLDYEDAEQAKKELRAALAILGG
ncbi:hypothetical protein D9757_004667 [Collybiopsis confluens]|uniref:DUF605-domain-containing protein n=1 Tax=Collybiopsis confluens TaxID=2823264 RepID=A0A8H5HSC4_9AGAR|nr:hypothetical protein D9757_004667 [Collybiopsis confluens]